MHSLLATNEADDLICVTEPWFSRIGVTRADDERNGRDVLGGAAHPNWDIHYPYFCGDQRAKVMLYVRKFSRDRRRARLPWRLVVRHDLGRHPSLLIADIHDGPSLLCIITFYHDVDDESSMTTLLTLDLDPTVPTILVGDFNLHSPSWSDPDLGRSSRSTAFEAWAAGQTFTLDTPVGTITRRGREDERPSTLDLTWHNLAADISADLSPPLYDWPTSLGSDHCGVRTYCVSRGPPQAVPEAPLRTFDPSMDDAASDLWDQCLDASLPLLWRIEELSTPTLLDSAASNLQSAVDAACSMAMRRRRTPGAHAHSWWTDACSLAAQAVRMASADERNEAVRALRRATMSAKRTWADREVTSGNVWDVAKWRHGRKSSAIAALREPDGSLTFEPQQMAALLADRFFTQDPGDVALHQADDPPTRPSRPLAPFTSKELWESLNATSSTTAPGFSGQTWGILKRAWERVKDHVTVLANACLLVGHHPTQWRRALVVVIPKPGRDD